MLLNVKPRDGEAKKNESFLATDIKLYRLSVVPCTQTCGTVSRNDAIDSLTLYYPFLFLSLLKY